MVSRNKIQQMEAPQVDQVTENLWFVDILFINKVMKSYNNNRRKINILNKISHFINRRHGHEMDLWIYIYWCSSLVHFTVYYNNNNMKKT